MNLYLYVNVFLFMYLSKLVYSVLFVISYYQLRTFSLSTTAKVLYEKFPLLDLLTRLSILKEMVLKVINVNC